MVSLGADLVLYALVLAFPLAILLQHFTGTDTEPERSPPESKNSSSSSQETTTTTIMQPERTDLPPPKDDPFTQEALKPFDGSDPAKPIYVAIKGTVFDVSRKRETYGPGGSYALFAGKDALKPEDAVPDWSTLEDKDRKTLDDWHSFFTKRYAVVGRVVDLPAAVANR
ncbi:cytochrome b5 [Lactarius psammicola]|nr:cytochrome b5 [Lactarius psammicola]